MPNMPECLILANGQVSLGSEMVGRNRMFKIKCFCGSIRSSTKPNAQRSQSCGCTRHIVAAKKRTKHGHYKGYGMSPTACTWWGMHARCYSQENKSFARYGGRGIKICERWHSFDNFVADMGERPTGTWIGRIDNDGDYSPDNCRWESPRDSANNRVTSRFIELDGVRKTLAEWSRYLSLPRRGIAWRLNHGWNVRDVLRGDWL